MAGLGQQKGLFYPPPLHSMCRTRCPLGKGIVPAAHRKPSLQLRSPTIPPLQNTPGIRSNPKHLHNAYVLARNPFVTRSKIEQYVMK